MSVKLTNFVKIKINHHVNINVNATRDTAVLIHYIDELADTPKYALLSSMPNTSAGTYTYLAGIKKYLQAFFNNGGKNIYVITLTSVTAEAVAAELEKVPMEYMVVGFVNDGSSGVVGVSESTFRTAATAWNESKSDEKIYQKIFVSEIPYASGISDLSAYEDSGNKAVSIENYVLKYGAQGIGASVLAYFTRVDVYSFDATQDYAFTTENYSELSNDHFVFNDNAIIEKIIALDLNADTKLAGQIKVVGGNDTAGYDLMNQFMLLVLHQTLTEAVLQVLVSKIKYNATGLNFVMNAIVRELNRFVSNGYLTTTKAWTDGDLYYDGYKIVDNNTILNTGYKVMILPFESLSTTERSNHQLPKIFILLADSYSIRKIVIDGEVF